MSSMWAVILAVVAVVVWPGRATAPAVGGAAGERDALPPGCWAARVWMALRSSRRARRVGLRHGPDDEWVADLAEVVAVGLEAGLDLPRAVLTGSLAPAVAERAPWLHPRVAAAVLDGRGVAGCLDEPQGPPSAVPGGSREASADAGLEVLVRAWRLTEEVGAAASTTTTAAAVVLRSRAADRRRAATLVAGPRASMWLLSLLPLLGPVLGLLAGVGPARLYGSPLARASAVVGVVLAVLGWVWARRLLGRAQRPGTMSGRRG